jgi:hypothetical protein
LLQFASTTREMDIQSATTEIVRLMFNGERKMEDDVVLMGVDV